jgi:hypothetical protein
MAQTATHARSRAAAEAVPQNRAAAGAVAGVVAGLVFLVLSMIYAAVAGPALGRRRG